MLSFHGVTIPRGQQRRWPHIATFEAVLGEEHYTSIKCEPPTPTHNVSLVFTRNVIGSMDYHGTTFSMKPVNCVRQTTDAHEMALAAVFESGWQCISVSPEGMKGHPAKGFLKKIPTAWDDTRFIAGRPDEYAVLARRTGDKWYVAGINADSARTVKVPMTFLSDGKYKATIYRDGKAGATPTNTEIIIETITVDRTGTCEVQMPVGGGFGIVLEKE